MSTVTVPNIYLTRIRWTKTSTPTVYGRRSYETNLDSYHLVVWAFYGVQSWHWEVWHDHRCLAHDSVADFAIAKAIAIRHAQDHQRGKE